ncbi:TetR/AcrR family transcriptional regulator [Mucilaginibacter lappiensis]|uniref:AcrR family transcriptional regulator n=1 Tax=Mucilaginibacter lappiensis TaxID=354630 RepID=A0A1N7B613_9SPHI|nr:TetR/AcrR family transcriptional regulator [Mucilaginibacter lappiensis]MBB6110727.1 AcrR family transcriptional regulator [Mucilaginibacter lappiensis]MBB6128227.1 AcrR family transcriptional regulator [Mucilaginibacter lappiensis]SIR46703.1 transcriptional regulator, TetR family [Mucilaginibacter lappiensis]
MGSKERVERLKAEVHQLILDAAMGIVKNEGCEAVSIRKIADTIEYSPTIVYSYFLNKEAVLIELSKRGFTMLINCIKQQLVSVTGAKERMETVLRAVLYFANNENELYQLMYTVGTSVEDVGKAFPALSTFINVFREEMRPVVKGNALTEEVFWCNYLICMSFVHGLVALNRYYKDIDPAMNNMVLKKAIGGIIGTIELS